MCVLHGGRGWRRNGKALTDTQRTRLYIFIKYKILGVSLGDIDSAGVGGIIGISTEKHSQLIHSFMETIILDEKHKIIS